MGNDNPDVGKNCGTCKRGSKSMNEPECQKCNKVELETKVKFSQWEGE